MQFTARSTKQRAVSVSSLRFTLPSAIHFGYGVAYQLGEGNECANYTQIDPTHRHGHIDGRLGRRLESDVSTRWGRISPRRNICLRRGAVHASRSVTEGTQIIAGLFERRLRGGKKVPIFQLGHCRVLGIVSRRAPASCIATRPPCAWPGWTLSARALVPGSSPGVLSRVLRGPCCVNSKYHWHLGCH